MTRRLPGDYRHSLMPSRRKQQPLPQHRPCGVCFKVCARSRPRMPHHILDRGPCLLGSSATTAAVLLPPPLPQGQALQDAVLSALRVLGGMQIMMRITWSGTSRGSSHSAYHPHLWPAAHLRAQALSIRQAAKAVLSALSMLPHNRPKRAHSCGCCWRSKACLLSK